MAQSYAPCALLLHLNQRRPSNLGDFPLLCCLYTDLPQHDPNPIVLLNIQRRNCPGFEGFHDENLMTTKTTTDTILHILVGAAFRPHEANLGLRIPDVGGSSVSHPVWRLHFSHPWRAMVQPVSSVHSSLCTSISRPQVQCFPELKCSQTLRSRPHNYAAHTSIQNQAMWWTLIWSQLLLPLLYTPGAWY